MRTPARLFALAAAAALLVAACQNTPLPQRNLPLAPPPANLQAQNAQALGANPIDDSDMSAGFRPQTAARLESEVIGQQNGERLFATRSLQGLQPASTPGLSGRLLYTDRQGQTLPAAMATASLYQGGRKVASALTNAQGQWQLPTPPAGAYQVRYTLENPRWVISNYTWQGPEFQVQGEAQGLSVGDTQLVPGSENAKAGWIHDVYLRSLALFDREQVPLDWWRFQIRTIWPGQGDYYTNNTVHLTGAEQWDVNGHEVGHAIYHQALNARSQGGFHKIDDCYSGTLALSEGFASFFSAAIHLERNDPDARFDQYLVPRRAPIRIENVPEDVCPGSRNEWRVASAFWDVYDTHVDGQDQSRVGMAPIFAALGRRDKPAARDMLDVYGLFKEAFPAEQHPLLERAFVQNTMEIPTR